MKERKKLTPIQKRTLLSVVTSITCACVMTFSILALNAVLNLDDGLFKVFFALAFFLVAVSTVNMAFYSKINDKPLFTVIKLFCLSGIYFGMGMFVIFAPFVLPYYTILSGIYLFTIFINRLLKIFEKKKIFNYIFNGSLALLALLLSISLFVYNDAGALIDSVLIMVLIMFIVSLFDLLVFAFSKIKLGAMMKIIRKTYVAEILYGLLVLIISFSFVFMIFESDFHNYGDALWYSFSIVTTIGFGDIAATGALTRVLSVVLGLYGIIVVAVITSVVVNFYNEVKNKKDEEEKEEQEEDKKE